MSNKNMKFYWGSGSPPCWKAMICLAEKGLWDGIDHKQCSFSEKEHKSEEVLKLNPRGQMPTFRDGNVIVNDSSAICFYLEDKYKTNKLLPDEPDKRAEVYQLMFEITNLQSKVVEPFFRTPEDKRDEDFLKQTLPVAIEELQRWNKYLEGKDFLAGSAFTLADVFFFPILGFMVRNKASFSNSPNLQRYYDKLSKRPSIQSTTPPHWKDTPSPGKLECLKA